MTLSKYLAALALFGLLAMTAAADPLDFVTGSTTGTFPAGNIPGVTFTGTSFSEHLLAGQEITLGTIKTQISGAIFDDKPFRLTVSFTAPPNTDTGVYMAELDGNLRSNHYPDGWLSVDFPETPLTLMFEGGSFEMKVMSFDIAYIGNATLTGVITAVNNVPEPASLFLVGSGLIAIGAIYRRRKQA